MRKRLSPKQQVSKAANVVIFLGILYTVVPLISLLGSATIARQNYGVVGIIVALASIALGYGIRHGHTAALYLATSGFAALSMYFFSRFVSSATRLDILRCIVTGWVFLILCRAIPGMKTLQKTNAFPLAMSRYGTFFLQRFTGREAEGRRDGEAEDGG